MRNSANAGAASQCQAAMRRRRHHSQANTPSTAGVSTTASPSVASSAIGMSASGLRRPNMAWCTVRSNCEGALPPPTEIRMWKKPQPAATSTTPSSSSDADSGRLGSISASEYLPSTGWRCDQASARSIMPVVCAPSQRQT